MSKFLLNIQKRDILGSKVKQLRKQGVIPGVIFGKGVTSQPISVKSTSFQKIFKEAGETNIIYLKVDGEQKERPTLVSSYSMSPVANDFVDINFHQVDLNEKVTANVPLEMVGESETIKSGLAILSQSLHEIEVECLPTEIPEKIEIDLSKLVSVGDNIKVSDIAISKDVEIKTDMESLIVSLSEPQKEESMDSVDSETDTSEENKKDQNASESTKTE